MFCIKCLHNNTFVTNSRPSKKHPQVWRRRMCPVCKFVFTTDELPRSTDIPVYSDTTGATNLPFNPGKLLLSITRAFAHDQEKGVRVSWDLLQTVTSELLLDTPRHLTTRAIAAKTHTILDRFDPTAAAQYALSHQLITSLRRRGRPSFGASA